MVPTKPIIFAYLFGIQRKLRAISNLSRAGATVGKLLFEPNIPVLDKQSFLHRGGDGFEYGTAL